MLRICHNAINNACNQITLNLCSNLCIVKFSTVFFFKMAPNIGDTIIIEPEEINTNGLKIEEKPPVSNVRNDNYNLMIFQSSINLLAHMLIGATVGICLCFAVRRLPMDATQVHIILCVIGVSLTLNIHVRKPLNTLKAHQIIKMYTFQSNPSVNSCCRLGMTESPVKISEAINSNTSNL